MRVHIATAAARLSGSENKL